MAFGVEEVAKLLGQTSMDQMAVRAASAAVKAARAAEGEERPDIAIYAADGERLSAPNGVRTTMLVPAAFKDVVELNLTPFVSNVGDYMRQKGIIPDSELLAFALDVVFDIGNLIPFGTLTKLTRAGRLSRLTARVLDGGAAGRTGADLVDAVAMALETAGRAGGASNEILAAARAGDRKALDAILDAALKAGDVPADVADLVGALRRDKSALGAILDNAAKFQQAGDLPPSMFLQASRAERLAAGQIRPLAGIVSPLAGPFPVVRQFLGIEYAGDRMWAPGSKLLADGLDLVAPLGDRMGLAAGLGVRETAEASGRIVEALGGEAAAYAQAATRIGERLRLLVALPNEREFAALMGEDVPDKVLDDIVRRVYGLSPQTKVDPADRAKARMLALHDMEQRTGALTDQVLHAREQVLEEAIQRRKDAYGTLTEVTRAMLDADIADLRRVWETFGNDWMERDPSGLAGALGARKSYVTFMASNYAGLTRDTLTALYPATGQAQAVADVLGSIIEHRDLFELRDGRLFLKSGITDASLREASPVLHERIFLDSKRGMLGLLTNDGLAPEVVRLVDEWGATLEAAGRNLVHEGVLVGTLGNFFPHVFIPDASFFKTFNVMEKSIGRAFERALDGADSGLADVLFGATGSAGRKRSDEVLRKARAGTLSHQESRRFAEDMMVRLVEGGFGDYEKDSVKVMAAYLDATHGALLMNRLFVDLPNSPLMALRDEDLLEILGKEAFDKIPANVRAKMKRAIDRKAWEGLDAGARQHYTELSGVRRAADRVASAEELARQSGGAVAEGLSGEAVARELRAIEEANVRMAGKAAEAAELAGKRAERKTAAAVGRAQRQGAKAIRELDAEMTAAVEGYAAEARALLEEGRSLLDRGQELGVAGRLGRTKLAEGTLPPKAEARLRRVTADVQKAARTTRARAERLRKRAEAALEAAQHAETRLQARIDRMAGKVKEAEQKALAAVQRSRARFERDVEEFRALADMARKNEGLAADLAQRKVSRRVDAAKKAAAAPTDRTTEAVPKVYVLNADAAALKDIFRMYDDHYSKGWERYDRWTRNIKALVLSGDLWTWNALSTVSFIHDPMSYLRGLPEDIANAPETLAGAFGKAVRGSPVQATYDVLGNRAASTVVGGAVGAAASPAFGADDPGDVGAFSLGGAMWGAAMATALRRGRVARRYALNPANLDTLYWMAQGLWTGRPDDRSIGLAHRWMRSLRDDLLRKNNGGHGFATDALDGGVHLLDGYEHNLWGVIHNGGKHAIFAHEWNRALARLEDTAAFRKMTPKEQFFEKKKLAAEVVQFANNALGGQSYARLFANPEWQLATRRVLIAPDWAISRMLLTGAMFANLGLVKSALLGAGIGTLMQYADEGFDAEKITARGPVFGALGGVAIGRWATNINRRMGIRAGEAGAGDATRRMARNLSAAALIGGYAVYNLMNYAFTGHFMWDNADGRKLEVQLPNGMTFNPGKPFVEAFEWASVKSPDLYPAPIASRLSSKLGPLATAWRVVSNRDYFGGPIITPDSGPLDVAYKYGEVVVEATFPIGLRGFGGLALQGALQDEVRPGAGLWAFTEVLGLPVRRQAGPIPGQRPDLSAIRTALGAPPSLGNPTDLLADMMN